MRKPKPLKPMKTVAEVQRAIGRRMAELDRKIAEFHELGRRDDEMNGVTRPTDPNRSSLHRFAGSLKQVRQELKRLLYRTRGQYTDLETIAMNTDVDAIFKQISKHGDER